MNRHRMVIGAFALIAAAMVYAQDDAKPAAEKPAAAKEEAAKADPKFESIISKVSYGIGLSLGGDMLRQGFNPQELEVDLDILAEGLKDALSKKQPQVSEEQIQAAMQEFQKAMAGKQEEKFAAGKKSGEEFLAANAKKEGVKTTDSGLQYQVIKEGKGDKPKATDKVTVHYKGTLIDGKEFDSSYERNKPASFTLNRVIDGWTEGVQLMTPGSKYRLFIPYKLGYGERGSPPEIPPYSVLVFEIELLEIDKTPPADKGDEK